MSRIKNSNVLRKSPQVVAAVHSPGALARALRLQPGAVDFLELRVDHFAADPKALLAAIPRLSPPLIVTVRHPAEGGANHLSAAKRRALFERFLPFATLIDLELRSLEKFANLIAAARSAGVGIIVSTHHFRALPSTAHLQRAIRRAHRAGADLCKIAALADTSPALARLLALFDKKPPLPLSVMGMGRWGKISRLLLAQAGSVLNYGYLDQPNASGQWEATILKQRLAELEPVPKSL